MPRLSVEDTTEIIECLKATDFTEVRLVYGEVELWVTRVPGGLNIRHVESWHETDSTELPSVKVGSDTASGASLNVEPRGDATGAQVAQTSTGTTGERRNTDPDDGIIEVASPMLGTFYTAPSPSEPPFVSIGDVVEDDTVVGIVEAMKLMTQVPSGIKGEVVELLVANEELVEFGQALMRIRTK